MQAIEFDAPIRDGVITIPARFHRTGFPAFVRVIVLSDGGTVPTPPSPDAAEVARRRAALRRLDGCLAGMDMSLDSIRDERLARQ